MEWIRVKLGFAGLFAVDLVGRSEGVALLWKEEKELEIQNYSRRHINAIVKRDDDGTFQKLACLYGDLDSSKRKELWALLKHLKYFSPKVWLCVGDFNEITHQGEKTSDARQIKSLIADFILALEDCSLGDLGFNGPRYMWTNKRIDEGLTLVRLDRVVDNCLQCEQHRGAKVFVLASWASDHNLIQIMFGKEEKWCGSRK